MTDVLALENMVLTAPPSGDVIEIPDHLIEPPLATGEFEPGADMGGDFTAPQLISADLWQQQWFMFHEMMGGMVQARSGHPCPLGDQARSEGGNIACRAAYDLLSANPALAKLFLSEGSTMLGQLLAVATHGFACVQIVRASRAGLTEPAEPQFQTTRGEANAA